MVKHEAFILESGVRFSIGIPIYNGSVAKVGLQSAFNRKNAGSIPVASTILMRRSPKGYGICLPSRNNGISKFPRRTNLNAIVIQ